MKPFIIAACTLMLISFGNSYTVQRDSTTTPDMYLERFLQQIFDHSVDAINICPRSKLTLQPYESGMLNALLETSQLGMNMHFSSLAEGPVQEEPHELPIAEAIPSDIGDFLSIARKKRSIEKTDGPTEIAKILPNGRVCFAGQTLRYRVPRDPQQARNFIGIINSFILFLSHVHGQQSGHFLPLRMAFN
eukprot:05755.XXX_275369_276493_1 [CDS] Oithona nana genome sequencing.